MRRRSRLVLAALGLGLAGLLAGCGIQAAAPPAEQPTVSAPPLTAVSPDVPQAVRVRVRATATSSFGRRARELTVRVRNVSCEGVAIGSGFAISHDLLVTNRHVVAGAAVLEVSTWDGHSLDVSGADVGVLGDLGVVVVKGRLPVVGSFGKPPLPGEPVTVAGYPLAGKLTLSQGTVIDRVDGRPFGIPGQVLRLSARVEHGNSGGPVLDRYGKVVGVVYAIEVATGFGLAIPVDTLRSLARTGGFEAVPPCGSG